MRKKHSDVIWVHNDKTLLHAQEGFSIFLFCAKQFSPAVFCKEKTKRILVVEVKWCYHKDGLLKEIVSDVWTDSADTTLLRIIHKIPLYPLVWSPLVENLPMNLILCESTLVHLHQTQDQWNLHVKVKGIMNKGSTTDV